MKQTAKESRLAGAATRPISAPKLLTDGHILVCPYNRKLLANNHSEMHRHKSTSVPTLLYICESERVDTGPPLASL